MNMQLQLEGINKIYSKIESLKSYILILGTIKNITLDEIEKDAIKRGAIERYLQLAIESCIDIAELIISDQRLPAPLTSKETIEILVKAKIIDEEFSKRFSKAASFRNILIHDYLKIDYKEFLQNFFYKTIKVFQVFLEISKQLFVINFNVIVN